MRIRVKVFVLGFVFVCLAAASVYAQQKSNANDTSLGDIARQLKARRPKSPSRRRLSPTITFPGPKDDASGLGASSQEKSPADATPEGPGGPRKVTMRSITART